MVCVLSSSSQPCVRVCAHVSWTLRLDLNLFICELPGLAREHLLPKLLCCSLDGNATDHSDSLNQRVVGLQGHAATRLTLQPKLML
eukprot:5010851-Amphidinium_carterae.1